MAVSLGEAILILRAESGRLSKDLDGAERSVGNRMKSMGAGMMKSGAVMSAAVTLPLMAMGKAAGEEMAAIEQANAETAKSLERMGEGSLVSVKGVQALAGELQKLSGVDDQLIQTGQNAILTLSGLNTTTKEGAQLFDDASRAMVDMAEAIPGMEVDAAGKIMAKAMAEPEKAASRLARVGIVLTKSQQAQIKKFTELGDTAAAQGVIVAAVGEKFKGAANITNSEKLDVMKDRFAGIGAELLTHLLPAFDKLAGWGDKVMGVFDKLSPRGKKIAAVVLALAAALGPVLMLGGALVTVLPAIGAALGAISLPVVAVVAGLAALGYVLVRLWKENDAFKKKVKKIWAQVRASIMEVLSSLKKTVSKWVSWARKFWKEYGDEITKTAKAAWSAIFKIIGAYLGYVKAIVKTVLAVLRGDWRAAWNGIKEILRAAWNVMKALVSAALKALKAFLTTAFNAWKALFRAVWNAIRAGAAAGWNMIKSTIVSWVTALREAVMSTIRTLVSKIAQVWSAIRSGVAAGWNAIKNAASSAVQGVVNWIGTKLAGAKARVQAVWDGIKNAIPAAWAAIKRVAGTAAQGVVDWVKGKLDAIKDAAAGLGERMKDGIRGAVNSIIRKWNDLSIGIDKKVVGGVTVFPGATIHTPNISEFAKGGIVSGPTLGLIGEYQGARNNPEVVAPLDRLRDLIGEGGITQNFYPTNPVEDMTAFMRRARMEARWAGMR